MSTYQTRDAVLEIVLVSDDAGVTWYPRGGDPTKARPLSDEHTNAIRLLSADAGATWAST